MINKVTLACATHAPSSRTSRRQFHDLSSASVCSDKHDAPALPDYPTDP